MVASGTAPLLLSGSWHTRRRNESRGVRAAAPPPPFQRVASCRDAASLARIVPGGTRCDSLQAGAVSRVMHPGAGSLMG
jgi:hypothetical protein